MEEVKETVRGRKRKKNEVTEERWCARSDMNTRYVIILSSIASDSTLNFSLAVRTKIHPRIRLSKWHGLNGNANVCIYDPGVFSRARRFSDARHDRTHRQRDSEQGRSFVRSFISSALSDFYS